MIEPAREAIDDRGDLRGGGLLHAAFFQIAADPAFLRKLPLPQLRLHDSLDFGGALIEAALKYLFRLYRLAEGSADQEPNAKTEDADHCRDDVTRQAQGLNLLDDREGEEFFPRSARP